MLQIAFLAFSTSVASLGPTFFTVVATTRVYAQKREGVRRVTPDDHLQRVLDKASPGDIITLAPGTYYGLITINKGGDARAPVVVRAEDPGTVKAVGDIGAECEVARTLNGVAIEIRAILVFAKVNRPGVA